MSQAKTFRRGKVALVTGASAGIGYAFCRLLAGEGYDLVLVASHRQKLLETAETLKKSYSVAVKTIAKDLSLPHASDEIYAELNRESIEIDILVNNAGVGSHGFFAETDLTQELALLELNMVALTHLTKLFLKDMLKKRFGKILNVASTAAFQPGPLMAVYYATKAYVLSFSEALAVELKGTGVSVTVLCPGPTKTEFFKRAHMEKPTILSRFAMDADRVAKVGYEGMMKNKTVVIPGWINRILALVARFSPRKIVARVVKIFQQT